MPLLELQEGIWHELRVDIQGMHPTFLAMAQPRQIRSRSWSPPTRSQSRASNTDRGSQNCTSRSMALYGSFATTAAHSRVNTEYVSIALTSAVAKSETMSWLNDHNRNKLPFSSGTSRTARWMTLNSCHQRQSSSVRTGRAGCLRFLVCVTSPMALTRLAQLT